MARRASLPFDTKTDDTTSSVLPGESSGSATITLVKPVLSENALRNLPQLQPRPKFGLLLSAAPDAVASAQPASETSENIQTLASDVQAEDSTEEELLIVDTVNAWKWDAEPSHSWDYKFAAGLVALLVIVNTGLVFLLHQDKGTQSVVETSTATALVAPAPPKAMNTHLHETIHPSIPVVGQPAAVTPVAASQSSAAQPNAHSEQDLLTIITKE